MPHSVRALLSQLGIPLNGEIEVYKFPGGVRSHGYGGWYMFVGRMLSKPPEDTNTFTLDGVRVWFTSGQSSRVPAFDGYGTSELRFITKADEYLK